ncbi:MAG: hypothetical protein JWM58_456 [Rhizobium sp.]|nr:hypothetical protein [Rhizobium sp.]
MLLLLSGCAKQPGDIVAAAIPTDAYLQMSCENLASERAGKESQLGTLSGAQEETANRDAAWMAIIHVPVASMSRGDNAKQIAELKGQINAIDQASQAKTCASVKPS